MKSEEQASAETLNLLRQQLILAQVRIMELADARDEQAPRLASLEKLLAEAQALADRKADEASHLEQVRAGLQQRYEHMRHMQHVTNQALEDTRAALTVAAGRESILLAETETLQKLIAAEAEVGRAQLNRLADLEQQLGSAKAESAARLTRVNELDAEQRAMKASRSWRWTAWLRSIERAFRRRA